MAFLSEAAVEDALLEQLQSLGYVIAHEDRIGPDGAQPERDSHDEVRFLNSALHKRYSASMRA